MIDKQNIKDLALLKLGYMKNLYNPNNSEIDAVVDKLLNKVIKDTLMDEQLMFNAKTIKLTQTPTQQQVQQGMPYRRYRYNLPVDYLGFHSFDKTDVNIEGEFIYSEYPNVHMTYFYNIHENEFPSYTEPYLIAALAKTVASTYEMFKDKAGLMGMEELEEKVKLANKSIGHDPVLLKLSKSRLASTRGM